MKVNTKERLKAMPMEDVVADEVAKRIELIVADAPADAAEAQAMLAKLNRSLDAKIQEAFANGLAGDKQGANGKWIANKVNGIAACVAGLAASTGGDPGEQAEFVGQVAGMTTSVTIRAIEAGEAGNNVLLVGDGVRSVTLLINDWNENAAEGELISLVSGSGAQIPDDQEEIQLAGGVDAVPGDETALDAAKAQMGADQISADAKDGLDHALADEAAGNDFSAVLAQAVSAANGL